MTRLDLIHELWDASTPAARCPHVQHDADGCRCGAVADPVTSRMVCDHFSLQLWCLAGAERWPVCESFQPPQEPTVYVAFPTTVQPLEKA